MQKSVIVLIFIGMLLRLWNLSQLFHFTYDEEVFAFVGKRMFVNGHIPLIGGVTPMHVHVAPYFYWLSGAILYLSKLNPLGWGVAAALISGITMYVLYLFSSRVFNRKVGIIVVFLYAFSFYQNIFDRHYWGIVFDGLVSLVVLYSLYKIMKGNQKYLLVLATALAWGIHADLSVLSLFILTLLSLLLFKPSIKLKTYVLSALLFLISFVPLVFFDIKHDFVNIRGINQYVSEIKSEKTKTAPLALQDVFLYLPRSLSRTLYVFGDTDLAKQYAYCKEYAIGRLTEVPMGMMVLVFGSFIYLIWKRTKVNNENEHIGITLILILFISSYIGIGIYGLFFKGDLFDHYLATLFPVYFVVIGYILYSVFKNKQLIMIGFLGLFALLNLAELKNAHHSFGYTDKTSAVKWAIESTSRDDISLDVLGDCFRYNGYRYLFYLYGKEPVKSYVDQNFFWLYDDLPEEQHPKTTVVITNPSWNESQKYFVSYNKYKKGVYKHNQFGRIEVMIINNKNGEYNGKY